MSTVYAIMKWAEKTGEPNVRSRIQLKMLANSVRSGVNLAAATPATAAPPEYVDTLRKVVAACVGRVCPV